MARLIIIAAVIVLIVLYLNRDRLKTVVYSFRSSLQNPVVRTHLLKRFFFTLGRLTRMGLFKRFFKP